MAAGATYFPIATQTLGSITTTVSFTSIPSTYTDLVLVYSSRSQGGFDFQNSSIRFNGDSGSNYSYTQMSGNGSSASSLRQNNVNAIPTGADIGTTQSGKWSVNIVNIQNYANATTNKTVLARVNAQPSFTMARVGLWRSTSAITSFDVLRDDSNGFSVGSTFTLYGIEYA
jgi:hypothetical protein